MTDDTTPRYAWAIAISGVFIVMGALGFARFGYTLILPRMLEALSLSDTQAGAIATANMLGYLLFSLLAGLAATRYGPRPVILVSIALTSAALFCTGLSGGFASASMWRFLAGAGGGGANVPMMGLIAAWFTSKRRGLASGIAVSGSSFALLFTGLVLPPVMASGGSGGWRGAWFLLGGITVGITVASIFVIKNAHTVQKRKEKLRKHIGPGLWKLSGLYILFGFSYVIFATFFARFLQSEAGFSESEIGRLWSLIGAISIASGFLWGAASDRFGRGPAFAGIFFIQSIAYGLFWLGNGAPAFVIGTVLFGLTAWSIPAVMGAAVGDMYGPRAAPAVFGFVTLVFGIGQAAGPAFAGRMADVVGSYRPAFLSAAIAALAAAPPSLLLRVRHHRES